MYTVYVWRSHTETPNLNSPIFSESAMVILGPTAKINYRQYFRLYGMPYLWGVYTYDRFVPHACFKILTITNLPCLGDYHRGFGVVSMPTYLRLHSILEKNVYMYTVLLLVYIHVRTCMYRDCYRLQVL